MSNENKFPNLFKPIRLRGVFFRNRIFAAPTGFMDQDGFGTLPPEAAFYYERKAKGGAASVAVGECNVDSDFGTGAPRAARLDNPLIRNSLCRISDAVRRQGAVCAAELQHAGNCANRSLIPPGMAYGPVDGEVDGRPFYEMPEDMIWRIVDKFAQGAAFAKSCGFGMVLLHGGHGWLVSQFLSPTLNTRKDKWGGPDIENRARLAVEILKGIRKAVGPAFPIEMRISGSECYDGGYGIEEGVAFAKQVEDYVDLLHVSAGSHEVDEVFTVTHPSIFLPDGCNVQFAEEIKKHVKCPVATVGALVDPELMEDIIASGKADVVEIARGLIADPDLPRKARTGRESDINKCLRCLNCFSNLLNNGQFHCAINPETGREAEMNFAIPPSVKKKILIAGGGIAGMQAALTCAQRGHEVILCEKANILGGALRCEENVPFKKYVAAYLERQASNAAKAGVEIRLNTEVTPEYVEKEGVDVLIAALGARPLVPAIPGIHGANVLGAEEAYRNPSSAGQSIVVLGAGLVGVELAIYLAAMGRSVSLVEMLGEINHGGNFLHVRALEVEIAKYGIKTFYNTKALEITNSGVKCAAPDGELLLDADTVVYATGQQALWDDAERLCACGCDFYMIGDCVSPNNIMNATSMAFSVARNI
ncbi:MAG: NAD(P)/FAD-dependent oxidoreductase [Oscillospiraceae bacterium]|nr:NAD(P)/FAD-dependent oxidoreductase [Oscillospiraceae bacterium]